jgi:hypothetical protein
MLPVIQPASARHGPLHVLIGGAGLRSLAGVISP